MSDLGPSRVRKFPAQGEDPMLSRSPRRWAGGALPGGGERGGSAERRRVRAARALCAKRCAVPAWNRVAPRGLSGHLRACGLLALRAPESS